MASDLNCGWKSLMDTAWRQMVHASENHNLNLIIDFFNDHKTMVSKRIQQIKSDLEKIQQNATDRDQRYYELVSYEGWYYDFMTTNAFLMMYSHLEEFLSNQAKYLTGQIPSKSGLEKFKEIFNEHSGFNLGDHSSWHFITECEVVRNIILHRRGNISLANKPKKIKSLIKRQHKYFSLKNSRLVVKDVCLQKFSKSIRDLTAYILSEMSAGSD